MLKKENLQKKKKNKKQTKNTEINIALSILTSSTVDYIKTSDSIWDRSLEAFPITLKNKK
jgi:hypothetical protein